MNTFLRIRNFFSARLPGSSSRRHSIRQVRTLMDLIPNEILSHIFQLILLDPDQNPAFSFSISQVCVRWRDFAVASPNLWTRIAFTFPVTKAQFVYAVHALQRSEAQPLSILMDCRDPEWDWEEDDHAFQWGEMQDIVERLLPHAARWKSVDILTDTWLPIYVFLRLTQTVGDLPTLESLSLSRCNAYFAARGQTFLPLELADPVPLFGGSGSTPPRLRTVSLVGVHVDWASASALRNLSSLEFKYHAMDVMPSLSQFSAILERCPQLEILSIIGWGPQFNGDPESSSITSIVLPFLTKLSLGFVDAAYGIQLLSLLHVPSLKTLTLENVARTVNPLEDHESTPILQWFFTSQPTARASFASPDGMPINPIPLQSVQTLELQSVRSNKEVFSAFFRCFPNLKSLSIFDVSDDALLALGPYSTAATTLAASSAASSSSGSGSSSSSTNMQGQRLGCVCPVLTELYCQDSDAEMLVFLVAGRALVESVQRLRTVTLEYSRTARPSYNSAQYARLENTGIEVLGASSSSEGSDTD